MARGRTRHARECYDRALQVARASHLRDAGAVMLGDVLAAELEFERTAGTPRRNGPRVSPLLLGQCGAWLDIYAAGIGVETETTLLRAGPEPALALVEDALEYARSTERPQLARFLSAQRVSVLLDGGEVEEAARAWRFDGLPERRAECLDLPAQSWREMEMLACARLRLFISRGRFDAAREFADALLAVASEHALVRTRMRGLALAIVLEHRAGVPDRASAHLAAYLRLFAEADYLRPLARERAIALALLDDAALADGADPAVAVAAGALREALGGRADRQPSERVLTDGELEVLTRLEHWRDKDIARALGLSYDGVRYRVRGIFAKLGARGRLDAVRRAQERGILPAHASEPPRTAPPPGLSR
jgi:ATP/maltotriose-dependent transcriptional regulator MalT